MNTEYFQTLYQYHHTLNEHLWESIHHLSDAQFTQEIPYSIGSVRNHVVHVMDVDQRWLKRVKGEALGDRLVYADFSTPTETHARWSLIEDGIPAYVEALDEAALDRVIEYDLPHRGGIKHNTVWQILAHVVNHGTDHRAQLLRILYEFGAPTFEQDFTNYLWSR